MGIIRALQAMRIRVPQEMRIVATDVYNLNFQEFCTPMLSSVTLEMEAAARTSCDMIHELSGLAEPRGIHRMVASHYYPRESCGPV